MSPNNENNNNKIDLQMSMTPRISDSMRDDNSRYSNSDRFKSITPKNEV